MALRFRDVLGVDEALEPLELELLELALDDELLELCELLDPLEA